MKNVYIANVTYYDSWYSSFTTIHIFETSEEEPSVSLEKWFAEMGKLDSRYFDRNRCEIEIEVRELA